MSLSLSPRDFHQIRSLGIDLDKIETQIENFIHGFYFVDLIAPATVKHGIKAFNESEINKYIDFYDENSQKCHVIKFVPASGAASRMFKHLFEFIERIKDSKHVYEHFAEDKGFHSIYRFIQDIHQFAFFPDLEKIMKTNGGDIEKSLESGDFKTIVNSLLTRNGLDYSSLPKGLLKFHYYPDGARTPLEEHLVEGANYCRDTKNQVKVHFTVSPEHMEKFTEHATLVKDKYEKRFGVKYDISFSLQKSSTDTIAVEMDNRPFHDKNGNLFFRPAGHGALIENLNDLKGDIIFIKNIDNVVPERLLNETIRYKKAIGGYLLLLQRDMSDFLRKMESPVSEELIASICHFCRQELMQDISVDFDRLTKQGKIFLLINLLNRPIRICGMVKNLGEPGGGPFWIKNEKGNISLQIVETSQIDRNNPAQREILNGSTHFNPVDIVCGVKNYKGESIDLLKYIDPSTGFISIKSKDGREIKAQELPGLWNGAMAQWITVFVDVPVITFNPVKTVNDLLREEHQGR
jgi:hypothetical protein